MGSMKNKLLVATQALAALSFVVSQIQTDPVGAAALALLGVTAVNVGAGYLLTFKKFGGSGEFNGPFSAKKLGAFLEENFATSRLAVAGLALLGSFFAGGMTQQALEALFLSAAAAQAAAIAADNAQKLAEIVAALAGKGLAVAAPKA